MVEPSPPTPSSVAPSSSAPSLSPRQVWTLIGAFALVKLFLHLATSSGYGYFRDELYYLACTDHLAWGYVDHPPWSIFVLWVWRQVFGDSLLALRFLPAVLGAATVALVGLMARRLGGGRWAMGLAMAATLATPIYLALDHFYSMNAWDLFFWALCAYFLIAVIDEPSPRHWVWLGVALGFGLLNKISLLWLGAGLAMALLATPLRRQLATRGPWLCAGLAFLIFSPHVVWQVLNDWPTREFIHNATTQKMQAAAPLQFLQGQLEMVLPSLFLWLVGLVYLFFHREGKNHRALGWIYLTAFAILAASGSSRSNYLAPAYTWLFAAGGVALDAISSRRWGWVRPALGVAILGLGAVAAPLALPILTVDDHVAYARKLGHGPATEEKKELGRLGQFFADMHGWPAIAATVAEVYRSLPPEEQAGARIFAPNYGVAGAIDFFGRPMGLPPASSGHNNYWLWGPGDWDGRVLIVLGGDREKLAQLFEHVEEKARTSCRDCMPYENDRPIFVARGLRSSVAEVWSAVKHYD